MLTIAVRTGRSAPILGVWCPLRRKMMRHCQWYVPLSMACMCVVNGMCLLRVTQRNMPQKAPSTLLICVCGLDRHACTGTSQHGRAPCYLCAQWYTLNYPLGLQVALSSTLWALDMNRCVVGRQAAPTCLSCVCPLSRAGWYCPSHAQACH